MKNSILLHEIKYFSTNQYNYISINNNVFYSIDRLQV